MKDWQSWLKEMVTLAMWILATSAIIWKLIDAWEKKTTAPIKKILDTLDKHNERLVKTEDCCKHHDEEMKGIKENAKSLLGLFIEQLKK